MASTVSTIIATATAHLNKAEMFSSAKLCLSDAQVAHALGDDAAARTWALRSLSYSVGVFHADYVAAAAL